MQLTQFLIHFQRTIFTINSGIPKRKAKEGQKEINITTVKCGLWKKCNNPIVFEQIKKDVVEMSQYVVEASIYINLVLYKKWDAGIFPTKPYELLDFFYAPNHDSLNYKIDRE